MFSVQLGCVCRQWMESLLRSRLQCVTFVFVLGHAGIRGDERGGSLASKATVVDSRTMSQADVPKHY